MQSHLCPAVGPVMVQPHITRPLHPALSGLRVYPDQTPMLLSTQLTLLLRPFIDLALPSPPISPIQEATPGLQRTGFFVVCPHQPFQLVPTPTQYSTVLALWGSFLTLSVYTYWPLCPRAREQCARTQQDTAGRWKTRPAIPSRSSRGCPCPLFSHSPQWVHLIIMSLSTPKKL